MADMFGDYRDRICPVAVIPMHTPDEAIEELEYVVTRGGSRGDDRRKCSAPNPGVPLELLAQTGWLDTYGIDSQYDYDPFWAKCVELGVAPGAQLHRYGLGQPQIPLELCVQPNWPLRRHRRGAREVPVSRGRDQALPDLALRVSRRRGGVGEHALCRPGQPMGEAKSVAIRHYLRSSVDRPLLEQLLAEYGPELSALGDSELGLGEGNDVLENDFEHCGIERAEDVRELFADRFYFGCEADDPSVKSHLTGRIMLSEPSSMQCSARTSATGMCET